MKRFAWGIVAPFAVVLAACSGSHAGAGGGSTSSTTTGSGGRETGPGGHTGGAGGTGGTTTTSGTGGTTTTSGTSGTGGSGAEDAGLEDGSSEAGTACMVGCTAGQCMEVSACAAIPGHGSTPGYCPGPADIECCTVGSVSDNPPVPTGWMLMMQADVTPAMTTWAVDILDDPTDYPMFSTAMMTFGTLMVLARVEWHPPDFQNCAIHRGVTLYQPG
jgi:hypothetical protein